MSACYHPGPMAMASQAMTQGDPAQTRPPGSWRAGVVALVATGLWGCISGPASTVPTRIEPPRVTWEDKLTWMMRLEDQRLVRDPNPPAPVVLVPATPTQPAIVTPPPPSDLIRLLDDKEGRVRRRASLALGRVGLADAVAPLAERLRQDEEFEVRQMAAFALGIIGSAEARGALIAALGDSHPVVQGRSAEALGLIGNRDDAAAIAAMVAVHLRAGAIASLDPDALEPAPAPVVEAVRLGLYALTRLGAFDALASVALDGSGQPVSRWWPVAYALQRVGDPRAATPLVTLLTTPGRYTAAFAARGLAALKSSAGSAVLRQLLDARQAPRAVLIEALRAIAASGDLDAAPSVRRIITDQRAELVLRSEALDALGSVGGRQDIDVLLDLMSDRDPVIRAGAVRALARLDADTFIVTLSALDPDRDWTVRAALATVLGTLPTATGGARLVAMLQDTDQRVVRAAMNALVASKSPQAERALLSRLEAEDFAVRATAADGLASLNATAAVPALVTALARSAGDATFVARAALLEAVQQLDPSRGRPLLEQALADPEWAVRLKAASLLQGASAAPPVSIRPAVAGKPTNDPFWAPLLNPQFSPHAFVETDKGTIEIELAIADAPQTTANFMALARRGFFNNMPIHRVVPDFVMQAGDPRGDSDGGPGYTIRDEINQRPYLRGTVGMALDWKDTGGSQFFITHSPQPHLDARYTVFGAVVAGDDLVEQLAPWDVIRRVRIWDGVSMSQ